MWKLDYLSASICLPKRSAVANVGFYHFANADEAESTQNELFISVGSSMILVSMLNLPRIFNAHWLGRVMQLLNSM